MSLRIDQAARDIDGAIRFVQGQPDVAGPKVGTIGSCKGGALSLAWAKTLAFLRRELDG